MRYWLCLLALLVLWRMTADAQPASPDSRAQLVRIAYTAFESPEAVQSAGTLAWIRTFLQVASDIVTASGRPLEFEVVVGNYYQVWSWFRARQIDAAIVSPFTAYLLEREGVAWSVLELPETGTRYAPFVAASGLGQTDPGAAYGRHLQRLLDEASGRPVQTDEVTRLNFVAHLSSSGFVMPTLYALDWLDGKDVAAATRRGFWERYFERARFTLHQGVRVRPSDDPTTDIYFSYSGRAVSRLKRDSEAASLGAWDDLGKTWPRSSDEVANRGNPGIPPDLLVVRRRLAEELLGTEDRDELANRLVAIAGQIRNVAVDTPFTGVQRFNVRVQTAFREGVDRLFGPRASDPTLVALTRRWFEQGRFDFTIDETIGFLRQDQRNSGVAQLALVLSGGGVKSLYQARHLDALYGDPLLPGRQLRNMNEAPIGHNGVPATSGDGPLTVHTIIGTSGGAMLAFYASLVPAIRGLTELARRTASEQLFPLVDVPRIASVVAIVLVFVCCLHLAKAFGWLRVRPPAGEPWQLSQGTGVLILAPLLLVATALAIRWLRVPYLEGVRYVRGIEGLLFGATAVLIHMVTACVTRSRAPAGDVAAANAPSAIALPLGTSMIGTAIVLRLLVSDADPADRILAGIPIVAALGIATTVAGILVAAARRRFGLQLVYAAEYVAALGLVLAVVSVSYVAIVLGALAGRATLLELTPTFWFWTGGGGLVVSAVVLLISRHGGALGRLVDRGVSSIVRDRVGGLTLTIGAGMTAFFTLAVLLWIALVAPAVYGSDHARDALIKSLPDKLLRSELFRSNLIVTGTLLADTACAAEGRPYVAGPLYSCFEGPTPCAGGTSDRWEVFRRSVPRRALQAVFASGSPFPVFPAHKVALPNGCEVPLVDGGYAHNVPLEAAVASEARQVLVINASPEAEDVEGFEARVLSDLARGARRIFPFLFSRAQELDRSMARRLMVASLTPHPEDRAAWPFLLDFRPEQQERVVGQADLEIKERRRIGHIEAWGTPMIAAIVRPEAAVPSLTVSRSALDGSRWLPHIRRELDAALALGGGVAVFDLDDTVLRGQIGQALFLKMVAELQYAGDRDDFWAVISDANARDTLRAYWRTYQNERKNGKTGRIHYADPSTWPNGLADYLALFQRQYREIVTRPDGERLASAWLARLLTGLSKESVSQLTWNLWTSEMVRGDSVQEISSAAHGAVRIDGGVRVHAEVADLIQQLEARGWQVWIVTAIHQFVAEEVAWYLGIPPARVLGIRSRVVDGVLSSELELPVPHGEGRLEALRRLGVDPQLVGGDSMADFELLRSARIALVVDQGRIHRGLMTTPPTWLLQPIGLLTSRVVYD